jgi:hypothetical protein
MTQEYSLKTVIPLPPKMNAASLESIGNLQKLVNDWEEGSAVDIVLNPENGDYAYVEVTITDGQAGYTQIEAFNTALDVVAKYAASEGFGVESHDGIENYEFFLGPTEADKYKAEVLWRLREARDALYTAHSVLNKLEALGPEFESHNTQNNINDAIIAIEGVELVVERVE